MSSCRGLVRTLGTIVFLGLLISQGCSEDSQTNPPPPEPPTLFADSVVVLEINRFQVPVLRTGELFDVRLVGETGLLFLAGLWVGGRVDGDPHASVMWVGHWPFSSFTSRWGEEYVGPYLVTPAHLTHPDLDWPVEYGAPIDALGEPRLYGDRMVWSALHADTVVAAENSLYGRPIPDLRIGQSIFGFDREGFREIIYVRYDLENLGDKTIEETYLGFYADTDLAWKRSWASTNATAYDSTRGLSYTYGANMSVTAPQWVCGFAFLTVPGADLPGTYAHRPMRKNSAVDPAYGEIGVDLPEQLLYALSGLDNNGEAMIDPTTGQPTRFAFTGDPVTGEGWLDVESEVRSLLSAGPFMFSPGEKHLFVVAFAYAFAEDRASAIAKLQASIDRAREQTELFE